jgi:hypothetical protein
VTPVRVRSERMAISSQLLPTFRLARMVTGKLWRTIPNYTSFSTEELMLLGVSRPQGIQSFLESYMVCWITEHLTHLKFRENKRNPPSYQVRSSVQEIPSLPGIYIPTIHSALYSSLSSELYLLSSSLFQALRLPSG